MENSKSAYSSYRWVVLLLFMFQVILTQFLWLNFAPIQPTIEKLLNITDFKFVLLLSVFNIFNLLLSLPVGAILDSKGFKFTVGVGSVIMAVAVLLRLRSDSYAWILAGQIGIAIAQPFIVNSGAKLASVWFNKNEEAIANGFASMAMFIGMIAALVITPIIIKSISLFHVIAIYDGVTVSGSLLFLLLAKDNPSMSISLQKERQAYHPIEAYKKLFKIKDMIILALIMFIGVGFFNGITNWLDKLLGPQGFTEEQSGIIVGILVAGGIVGAVVIPILSDLIKRRKPFLVTGTIAAGVFMYPLMQTTSYTTAIVLAAILGFLVISLLPIIFQMTIEVVGEKLTGSATGMLWVFGATGAIATIYTMEFIGEKTSDFRNGMWLLMAMFVIAFLLSLILKETYGRQHNIVPAKQ
ncbi:MAG: MFS transporter [Deltaproteobacteria bacterium]|nr:MFS transporter [Deltaproteobacteria bacterium]MCL5793134.1 MFS transporter [Deltaproteobacteria bacterium]